MTSSKGRWYGKRNEWKLRVAAMCPDQGSATRFGREKVGEMSTRLKSLRGSRKRHERWTSTATSRASVICYSSYTLGTNEHMSIGERRLSATVSDNQLSVHVVCL